jgi:uncharacterized RDD family membrane protein YckC
MARTLGSWLSGPEPSESSGQDRSETGHPGKRLGLPESGPRSLARSGRRIGALIVDWLLAYGLAALLMKFGMVTASTLSTAILVIWFVVGAAAVRLFGFTPGHYALGLAVVPVDAHRHVGLGRALARGLLLALVVPGLITDSDGRGLHDRATNTAVVRQR